MKHTFKPRLHATLVTLTVGRVPRERTKRKQKNGVMMAASELNTQSVGLVQIC